ADRKLAQIAVGDIAACAVSVLESRAKHEGKRYDIGGDELSGNEAVAILSKVKGKPFEYFQVPMDMIRQRMGDDGAKMYEWFERVGYSLDLAALRRDFPDVEWHTFEAWAREQTWF
ncbi:MAG TPA: NmrA family NAD(P)-binding protein, partial [Polyangiaceae bacterium]|nr:NmrA family NAD(P)-binding protein [Polyangiaceae bacterium]